jgi:hypothetical protein
MVTLPPEDAARISRLLEGSVRIAVSVDPPCAEASTR